MNKFVQTYIFLTFLSLSLFAQPNNTAKENVNISSTLYYTEDFSGAIRLYKQMLLFDPKNPVFNYKLAFAYLNTFGKQDSAIIFFNKTLQYFEKKNTDELNEEEVKFYLARAYRLNGNIDSAVIILENLRKNVTGKKFKEIIDREIKLAQYSLEKAFTVENLGTVINSTYSEHTPVFSPKNNFLVFTSKRGGGKAVPYGNDNFDENIYISYLKNGKWTEPVYIQDLNTEMNDATISMCSNYDYLLMYRGERKGDIYLTEYKDGHWTKPKPLPAPINTRHRETHAVFTKSMDTIFFTSNRPGGKGELDIWMSIKTGDSTWGEPVNLKGINSKYNEESPYITEDGKKMYFSSDRPGGYGGYDIYVVSKTTFETWTLPKNLGFPINSVDDDVFFEPIPNTNKAFYTSFKYDSEGAGDLFIVALDSSSLNTETINRAQILDTTGHPVENAVIYLINMDNGSKTIYRPKNGVFIFYTKANFTYDLKIEYKDRIVYEDQFTMPSDPPEVRFYKTITIK